jgi:hypothetical protein
MRHKAIPTLALVLIAGAAFLSLSLSMGVASVSASSARNGQFHATKDCSTFNPSVAGTHCTIVGANLAEIPDGSPLYYVIEPAASTALTGVIDSNVVLDAGNGDRAVGRCTLDVTTNPPHLGLCTFSDGTGNLTGFQARVDVSCPGPPNPCSLAGTYRFRPQPPR